MMPEPLPLFSPTALMEAFNRNPSRTRKLISYFLEDLPPQLEQLQDTYHTGNLPELGALAHSLKSSARQVGAFRLGEAAAQLEQAARYKMDPHEVDACWQRLQQECTPTRTAMEAYLAQTFGAEAESTPQ